MTEPFYDPSDRPDDDLTREEFEAAMQGPPEPPTVEDKRCNCARPEITFFNRRCLACNLMTTPPAERPTPITDLAANNQIRTLMNAQDWERAWLDMATHARDLERQLAEASDNYDASEINLTATIADLRDCKAALKATIEQRDRLADALRKIALNPGWLDNECGFMSGHIAKAALATLERKEGA